MKLPFRKFTPTKAMSAPITKVSHEVPDYLAALVAQVEENWEVVDPEQFDHAFEASTEAALQPLEQIEDELENQGLELRSILQRMIEIAPDFFDKALRRSGWESGYLIDGDGSHV